MEGKGIAGARVLRQDRAPGGGPRSKARAVPRARGFSGKVRVQGGLVREGRS